jgi:hypothetical protein
MSRTVTPSKQQVPKKEFFAYVAGYFDGEGSVYIYKNDDARYKGKEYMEDRGNVGVKYGLRWKLTNTNLESLEYVKARIGGTIHLYRDIRRNENNPKTQYTLDLYADKAMKVLQKTLPYLIIKQEVAQEAIKFQLHLNRHKENQGGPGYKVPKEEMEWRENQRELLKKINKGTSGQLQRLSVETPSGEAIVHPSGNR